MGSSLSHHANTSAQNNAKKQLSFLVKVTQDKLDVYERELKE
jgi:hypothetical protein